MKHILRSIQFVLILSALYFVAVYVFSTIGSGATTIMKIATRNHVTPGGRGFALQRYRDIENYRDVDMVFLGSSHCYRTYDTRIYEKFGYKTFNMGTTGQTPLNSYYLLKGYFDQLHPKLVIFDINYRVINRDGLECFYDLSQNIDYFPEMLDMAFAIKNFHAINGAVSKWLLDITDTAPEFHQKKCKEDFYVPGGYVEFKKGAIVKKASFEAEAVRSKTIKRKSKIIAPRKEQLDYITKTIQFVKSKNAQIILITKPEPASNLEVIVNYNNFSRQITQLAARNNVQYVDFNFIPLPVELHKQFYDKEYLNSQGVEIFNPILIRLLYERKIISRWKVKECQN